MPISISCQGSDHSTESVEAVQGSAATEQEEEEREEEVEIVEKRRRKRRLAEKEEITVFVTKNDASCVRCIKYSFVIIGGVFSIERQNPVDWFSMESRSKQERPSLQSLRMIHQLCDSQHL